MREPGESTHRHGGPHQHPGSWTGFWTAPCQERGNRDAAQSSEIVERKATVAELAIAGGTPLAELKVPAWLVHDEEEKRRVLKVLESGCWAYDGEMEAFFNETWAAFNGSKHSLLVTNGTHALQLAYEALDIGWGDEVLVPASTWQATAAAAGRTK